MTPAKMSPSDCNSSQHNNINQHQQQQQNGQEFVQPQHFDVLCGRGKDCFEHYGNMYFRQLIQVMLPQYVSSNFKKNKMRIIRIVVDKILEQGGRFLKKDVHHDQWYDGGIVCGKDKVGHAFRDAKVQARKCNTKARKGIHVQASTNENCGAVALAGFEIGTISNRSSLSGGGASRCTKSYHKSPTDNSFVNHDLGKNNPLKVTSFTHSGSSTSSSLPFPETKPSTRNDIHETPYSMNNARMIFNHRTTSQMDDVHAASSLLILQQASERIQKSCTVSVPKKSDETTKAFYFI